MYSAAERLVGEAHVHDAGGMALGARQVDEAAVGQQVDAAAVGHRELLDERAHLALTDSLLAQAGMLISTLKWPELQMMAPSFMTSNVLAVDDVEVAGDGDPDVADLGGLDGRHHAVAVHDGLERLERVDLEHDDVGAHARRAHRDAAAAPAVAGDDDGAAGDAGGWWRG